MWCERGVDLEIWNGGGKGGFLEVYLQLAVARDNGHDERGIVCSATPVFVPILGILRRLGDTLTSAEILDVDNMA